MTDNIEHPLLTSIQAPQDTNNIPRDTTYRPSPPGLAAYRIAYSISILPSLFIIGSACVIMYSSKDLSTDTIIKLCITWVLLHVAPIVIAIEQLKYGLQLENEVAQALAQAQFSRQQEVELALPRITADYFSNLNPDQLFVIDAVLQHRGISQILELSHVEDTEFNKYTKQHSTMNHVKTNQRLLDNNDFMPHEVKQRLNKGHGFDLVLGLGILCACFIDTDNLRDTKTCGGLELKDNALYLFLNNIIQLLSNNVSAFAIVSGNEKKFKGCPCSLEETKDQPLSEDTKAQLLNIALHAKTKSALRNACDRLSKIKSGFEYTFHQDRDAEDYIIKNNGKSRLLLSAAFFIVIQRTREGEGATTNIAADSKIGFRAHLPRHIDPPEEEKKIEMMN